MSSSWPELGGESETSRRIPPRRRDPSFPRSSVGMPSSTLRVGLPSEPVAEDAERPGRHSHAERGNEFFPAAPGFTSMWWCSARSLENLVPMLCVGTRTRSPCYSLVFFRIAHGGSKEQSGGRSEPLCTTRSLTALEKMSRHPSARSHVAHFETVNGPGAGFRSSMPGEGLAGGRRLGGLGVGAGCRGGLATRGRHLAGDAVRPNHDLRSFAVTPPGGATTVIRTGDDQMPCRSLPGKYTGMSSVRSVNSRNPRMHSGNCVTFSMSPSFTGGARGNPLLR